MVQLGKKSLVKSNLEYWLNDKFLREGLYSNISVGQADVYGRNISRLIEVSDPSFIGSVYQSAFKNWVYESGIPSATSGIAAPFVASGIVVDNTFYPSSTSGTYEHFIDWPNGRVIFTNELAGSPTVEAAFSYRDITISFASRMGNETEPLLIETALKDNPAQTGIDSYPEANSVTLPAVFIDILSRTSRGYELGSKSLMADFIGTLHVWTRDDFYTDIIEDILTEAQHDVIPGINFNTAPFPLLVFGELNPSWPGYSQLADVNSSYFWRRIYLNSTESRKVKPLFEVERSRVDFTIRVYPNF